jgi:hypothetical protein
MTLPRSSEKLSSAMSWRMAPVPLISSPCSAAVTKTTGPSSGARRTCTGIFTIMLLKLSLTARSMSQDSPAAIE